MMVEWAAVNNMTATKNFRKPSILMKQYKFNREKIRTAVIQQFHRTLFQVVPFRNVGNFEARKMKCVEILNYIFSKFVLETMPHVAEKNLTRRKPKMVPTFLKKTFELLNNPANTPYIHWSQSGIGFIITDELSFAKTVLPLYFKHSNYSSFIRQLNMYNFHKIRENGKESYFHHQCFDRDNEEALADIRRKPERKAKKCGQFQDQPSEEQLASCILKKDVKVPTKKRIIHKQKSQVSVLREISSDKKVQSPKNTQNIVSDERCGQCLPALLCQSSDHLSMQLEQNIKPITVRGPRLLTRELISASKNNLFPISVENVATSILSIFN